MTAINQEYIKKPVPLKAEPAAPNPYPIHALYKNMRKAAEAISGAVQTQISVAAQCIIANASYLAQTRANTGTLLATLPGRRALFFLTLVNSGDGKSAVRKLAYKVTDEIEKEQQAWYAQERLKIITQAKALKGSERKDFLMDNPLPVSRKSRYTDTTYEPIVSEFIRGTSAARWDTDEGSQALCGYSFKAETVSAMLGGLTKAFDDGSFSRNRSAANLDDSGTVYHRRLMISLLAQISSISSVIFNETIIKSGFFARFLFDSSESLAGTRIMTIESLEKNPYQDKNLQEYWERCQELIKTPESINSKTGEVIPPVIEPVKAAKQVWVDYRNEIEIEQGPLGKFREIPSFANRSAELALRLATVMAFFEKMPEINADCMARACEIARHSLNEWHRFIEAGRNTAVINDASYVMGWMLESKRKAEWLKFDKNTAGKNWPQQFRIAKIRDQILRVLVQHNQILTEDGKVFSLNPFAESAETAEPQEQCGFASVEGLRKSAEKLKTRFEAV